MFYVVLHHDLSTYLTDTRVQDAQFYDNVYMYKYLLLLHPKTSWLWP